MIMDIQIPEIGAFPQGFPNHWLNIYFMGRKPGSFQAHAITTTYVRCVESALSSYALARAGTLEFWDVGLGFKFGAINGATTHFETCITNMHRAGSCMTALHSRNDIPPNFKSLISPKPRFARGAAQSTIRTVRRLIQHLEQKVLSGDEIPENSPFFVKTEGPEVPVEGDPGQTIKTLDRLKIGAVEVPFSDLCEWLIEMGEYASSIATYQGEV